MDTIYTIGGGVILEGVFNAIAAMFSGGVFVQILKITAALGVIWLLIAYMIAPDWSKNVKWFVVMAVGFNIMLLPKITVTIQDQLEPMVPRHVDNVPFVLGRFASVTSTIGQELTEIFDMDFALPDDIAYAQNGFLFGSNLMNQLNRITITDTTLRHNVEKFGVRCIKRSIELGMYSYKDILDAPNLFEFLQTKGLTNLRSVTFEEDKAGGGYDYNLYTCQEAFEKIVQEFNINEKDNSFIKLLAKTVRFSNSNAENVAPAIMASALPANYEYFLNQSRSAVDILYHHLLVNSYQRGVAKDASMSYADIRAKLQSEQSYYAIGNIARDSVPYIRVFFEVILYASFPLIVVLLMLPGAPLVFYNYVSGLIWIQLWGPIYAVIHFGTTLFQSLRLQSLVGDEGYSAYNIATVTDITSGAGAIFSYMAVFVPYIAFMIMRGFQSMIHMSSAMTQPATSAAESAAAESSTGNISLGQMQFRNTSHDINNAFNYESGMNFSAASSVQHGNLAIERFGDGDVKALDTTPAMTRSQGDFKSSYSLSGTLSTMAGESKSMGDNYNQEAMNSFSSSFEAASRMAHHFNQGKESGEGWTKGVDAETRSAFEEVTDMMNRSSAHASVEGGFSVFGIGAKGGLNKELSKQEEERLSDSLAVVNRAAKEGRFNITDSEGNSLNEELNSSWSEYNQISERKEAFYNQSKNLSEEARQAEELGVSYVQDNASGFYNFLTEDKGYNLQESVDALDGIDVEHSTSLYKEYMEDSINDIYSSKYGQDLIDDATANINTESHQANADQLKSDNQLQNRNAEVESAYNNTVANNGVNVDKSTLQKDVELSIENNQLKHDIEESGMTISAKTGDILKAGYDKSEPVIEAATPEAPKFDLDSPTLLESQFTSPDFPNTTKEDLEAIKNNISNAVKVEKPKFDLNNPTFLESQGLVKKKDEGGEDV